MCGVWEDQCVSELHSRAGGVSEGGSMSPGDKILAEAYGHGIGDMLARLGAEWRAESDHIDVVVEHMTRTISRMVLYQIIGELGSRRRYVRMRSAKWCRRRHKRIRIGGLCFACSNPKVEMSSDYAEGGAK
jgi:hypothetical protein